MSSIGDTLRFSAGLNASPYVAWADSLRMARDFAVAIRAAGIEPMTIVRIVTSSINPPFGEVWVTSDPGADPVFTQVT